MSLQKMVSYTEQTFILCMKRHLFYDGGMAILFQILTVKRLDVVKRYFLQVVIKVGMARAGHNEQLLIVARQPLEGVLAHVS